MGTTTKQHAVRVPWIGGWKTILFNLKCVISLGLFDWGDGTTGFIEPPRDEENQLFPDFFLAMLKSIRWFFTPMSDGPRSKAGL